MTQREHRAASARMTTIAISIMLIGGSVLAIASTDALAQQVASPSARTYHIAAGPLGETLAEFAASSAVSIVFDPASLQGKQAQGLNGQYSVEDGFRRLLQGSGFQAVRRGAREFVLEAVPVSDPANAALPTVTIAAQAERDLSTEGTGSYAARGASILKGAQSLKDIPQSVTVMTRQQMDDQGLYTLEQVLNNTTGITLRRRPGGGNDVISRAFETNTVQYEGVPLVRSYSNGNMLLANSYYLDRVEILRGAQGLLEGAGGPAGSINLVRKRGLADSTFMVEGRVGSWNKFAR